ncbi:alkaline shock response membrane anchor protein AmaP [Lactococcus lactis]|uniref:alkaline shock response membrane anchor protein AmaP n=1 Tax=Lactococcus lactis TaxID=1358 RepID=UPI00223ADF3A|nr:alkaline shock response membrane anchor protein AmaP [Lactococcus lactis]
MATGKKIILIILDLLLLTLVLPMTWDYYNFMEYDWMTTTSSNIPFIGKYMTDYLFWGNIVLAVMLIIALIVILFYSRTYIDVRLTSNNGNLTLKKSAIEGFISEKVKENDYLKNSKIDVSLFKNKIKIYIKGEIIPIREGQMIIGWTHPFGSGQTFMEDQALPKKLIIVDLDSNSPCIYYDNKAIESDIPKGLLYKNSFYAGYAGVLDALLQYGFVPTEETKIAILGSGNVAQGAFSSISKYSSNIRMYYRKTMSIFKESYRKYDVIINGIEIGKDDDPILSLSEQKSLKKGTLIIDVAADAGNTIEGTHFTSMNAPIYEKEGKYYYVVPNTPSLIYRNVSQNLSKILSEHVFKEDCSRFIEKVKHLNK